MVCHGVSPQSAATCFLLQNHLLHEGRPFLPAFHHLFPAEEVPPFSCHSLLAPILYKSQVFVTIAADCLSNYCGIKLMSGDDWRHFSQEWSSLVCWPSNVEERQRDSTWLRMNEASCTSKPSWWMLAIVFHCFQENGHRSVLVSPSLSFDLLFLALCWSI